MVDEMCSTLKAKMTVKRVDRIICITAKLYMHRDMPELAYRYKDAKKEKISKKKGRREKKQGRHTCYLSSFEVSTYKVLLLHLLLSIDNLSIAILLTTSSTSANCS